MLWLLALACIDDWCARFNLVCEAPPEIEAEVQDFDGDVWQPPDDCDDFDPDVHPGAVERCNDIDDDCDGIRDEGLGGRTVYEDRDGDGYGSNQVVRYSCSVEPGWVDLGGDCNDAQYGDPPGATIHPGAREICNGEDDDCDGLVDANDPDLSGAAATEAWPDADGDGYGDPTGEPLLLCPSDATPSGYALFSDDCDESDPEVFPGADEVCADGVDNDCDAVLDPISCRSQGLDASALLFSGDADGLAMGNPVVLADVDGDGNRDLLVGGLQAPSTGAGARLAMLLGPLTESRSLSDADITLSESEGASSFAISLGLPHDVDGDGWPDLLVGAQHAVGGAAWLLRGPLSTGALDDQATWIFADETTARAGTAVVLADLTGDGIHDLVIGAGLASTSGSVWLFAGPASGTVAAADATVAISQSDPAETALGRVLVEAGDTDGDGIRDLLVSAPALTTDGAGEGGVYQFRGPLTSHRSTADADLVYLGTEPGASVGGAVVSPGDVDGDGLADLVIGAPRASEGASREGAAFVVSGAGSGLMVLDTALATIRGVAADQRAGTSLATPGDADGDGHVDLVIGVPGDATEAGDGSALLLLGPFSGALTLDDGAARWTASANDEAAGRSLYAADADGDGVVDLAVGAPGYTEDAEDVGAVWLLFGPLL